MQLEKNLLLVTRLTRQCVPTSTLMHPKTMSFISYRGVSSPHGHQVKLIIHSVLVLQEAAVELLLDLPVSLDATSMPVTSAAAL